MIKLQVHNDGKEKWQSFEARLDESESNIYLNGYGQNKEEAISELKTRVEDKIKELQSIDWIILIGLLGMAECFQMVANVPQVWQCNFTD